MLAIEIDGCSHNEKSEEDRIRQAKLESLGIRFLRFYDSDIKKNIQGVLWVIENWIREHATSPTPNPSKEGNEPTPNPSQEGKKKAVGDSRGLNKYTLASSQEGKKHTPNPLSRGEYKSPLLGGDAGVGNAGRETEVCANKDSKI